MSQKRFLQVKDFDALQMYKDRNPIWIKLYCSMLDDYEFAQIPDETKFHAVGLMLLASRLNNKFPDDETWLRQKINANAEINLKLLLEIGFLEPLKGARKKTESSFKGCKSLKTKTESVTQNEKFWSVEQNRTEQNKKEHNTTEQTRELSPDAEKAAVRCVDSENLSQAEDENQIENNLNERNFDGRAAGDKKRSQFTLEECLRYVEICLAQGEAVKNAKGLANHLQKTGESDAFIRAALYPEKQTEIDRRKFGEPRRFTDELCSICYGAKMSDVDGKGFRACPHCKNERGKSTGFEPDAPIVKRE